GLLHALGAAELAAIRAARRVARERAWALALGARPATVTLDFDAQLMECHTEKEGAAPHRKGGFGFHPLHCFLDETGEQLAAVLRPGNAGSNTAADHVQVLEAALEQLPDDVRDREREQPVAILARSDSAGATHAFAAALRQQVAQLRFPDTDGHRYTCLITDQDDNEIAQLERRHRLHARVEDRIQESQELGLGRLPFQALAANKAWFELALLAHDLLAW